MCGLQGSDAWIEIVLTGKRRRLDLIRNGRIIAEGTNGVGNGKRPCPILARDSKLSERRKKLDVAWVVANRFNQNLLGLRQITLALQI
jgi:hypothetical protein